MHFLRSAMLMNIFKHFCPIRWHIHILFVRILMLVLTGENLGPLPCRRGSGYFRSGSLVQWRSGERDAVSVVRVALLMHVY